MASRQIVESLHAKVSEVLERTDHLISLVPSGALDWRPESASVQTPLLDIAHLLGHLLDCVSGFCACFQKAFPGHLAHFSSLRDLEVNHACSPQDARIQIATYTQHIDRGFGICVDPDLSRLLPTVFVPEGESLATLLLGNLEHLLNHKYQLFFYLRLLGVPVGTRDLYRLRGETQSSESKPS